MFLSASLNIFGILPGHMLLGAKFTATSIVGMIALARKYILLILVVIPVVYYAVMRGQIAPKTE